MLWSFSLFLVHSTVGVGAPPTWISTRIGSPARTLIFLPSNPSRFSDGASARQDPVNRNSAANPREPPREPTFERLRRERMRRFRRLPRPRRVLRNDPVLVLVPLVHPLVRVIRLRHGVLVDPLPPSREDLSPLDVVADERRPAVARRRRPSDLDEVLVGIHGLRATRFPRHV